MTLLLRGFGDQYLEHIPALGTQGFVNGITGVDEFFHSSPILP